MSASLVSNFSVYPAIVASRGPTLSKSNLIFGSHRFQGQSISALERPPETGSLVGLGVVNLGASHEIGERDIKEKLFDALVNLKVSISSVAMHIPASARSKLFNKLDELLDEENWYEEDELPKESSIGDFIKWTIYVGKFNWQSLGISDEGNLLVAYNSAKTLLTLNFVGSEKISWTSKTSNSNGIDYAAGKSHLRSFANIARFYLDE